MLRDLEMTARVGSGQAASSTRIRRQRTLRDGVPVEVLGVAYLLIVVLAGGALVWQPARIAQMNQQIAELDSTLRELKMRSEALKKTVSTIESLDYIEKEARSRFGMVSPEEVRTISVTESEVLSAASVAKNLPDEKSQTGGIMSLFGRIAQIFGVREATAKGKR